MTIVATIQMTSGPEIDGNLAQAEVLIARAAEAGARLVVLPENFALMGYRETDKVAIRESQGEGLLQNFLAAQAARHKLWLVGGTIPLMADDANKVRAACLLFDENGRLLIRYDKVHLFDVQMVDTNESYRESDTIEPGTEAVVIDTPFGRLGLAVCYDLRFPELFRLLLDRGMEILALPSAFTVPTGQAHWEPLLRARAIENQCYVLAAAQQGPHANGRETFGDSSIIDPWGVVIDRLPRDPGVVLATLDRERLVLIRRRFPALQHRRLSCGWNRTLG